MFQTNGNYIYFTNMKYLLIVLLLFITGCHVDNSRDVLPEYEKIVDGLVVDTYSENDWFSGPKFFIMIDFGDYGIKNLRTSRPVAPKNYNINCTFKTEHQFNIFDRYNRLDISTFNRNCKVISKSNE